MATLLKDRYKIGDRLRDLRLAAGQTQAKTSELADIASRTYAEIERGNAGMRVDTLLRICEALNVTPNDILTDTRVTALSDEAVLELYRLIDPDGRMIARMADYLSSFRTD